MSPLTASTLLFLYFTCLQGEHRRRKVDTSCATFLLCDTDWYVHKPDVKNKWDDNIHTHNVVVGDDSNIQRFVLVTEETTVAQRVSHRSIKYSPARGHKKVRRSKGHIMVTTRYSDQQGSKSR